MSEHKHRTRITVLIALAALALYIGGIAVNVHRDRTNRFIDEGYSGKITSITGNRLIVNDVLGHREDVLFSTSTRVIQGRSHMSATDLTVGVFIIISGKRDGGGPIMARTIRVLDTPGDLRIIRR